MLLNMVKLCYIYHNLKRIGEPLKMKLKFKLSIMVIAIMVVVVTTVAVMLLMEASNISRTANLRGLMYMAKEQAQYWKGREDAYLRALHTLADVMNDYESIVPEQRRDRYDDMLRSALEAEPNMVTMYTIWKPMPLTAWTAVT